MMDDVADAVAAHVTEHEEWLIETIAQRIYDKLQAGLLKLSHETGVYLQQIGGSGYVGIPVALTPGPNALMLHSAVTPSGAGIVLEIKDAYGTLAWRGVLSA